MNTKFKEKALAVLEKLNDKKTTAVASVAAAAPALLSVGASAAETNTVTVPTIADSVTADMLNGIVTQLTAILPVALPTVVALLAFRKGISFLMSMLRGA